MYKATYYATPPSILDGASSADLRGHYLISDIFVPGEITLTYVHQERMVIGGAVPGDTRLRLPDHAGGEAFLDRRELGIINIGEGPGTVTVDGTAHVLDVMDALYIGKGAREVVFAGPQSRFYLASTPAHATFDTRHLSRNDLAPLLRGEAENCNDRAIYQFITPETCPSAQLLMGLTLIKPGSVWNTMPPHLHERRSEIYFYFGMNDDQRLFHFVGSPSETRHVVVRNEEAVICPPWSLHMGVGVSNYAFIWAMGGDNLDYDDMAAVDIRTLR